MGRMVKRQFTMDNTHIYIVNDGVVERMDIDGPLGHYADTGPNVGYLDTSRKWALMIRGNNISRITYDAFMKLRKEGVTSGSQYPGIINIEYDIDEFPDSALGMTTQYKLADKDGGDFDNVELGEPTRSQYEPVKNNIDSHVPDLVQDLGVQILGRQVTEKEILVYKEIVDAVDSNAGESLIAKFNGKMDIVDKLRDEETVMYNHTGSYITFAVPDNKKLHFMRRAIEMYDGAHIVAGGNRPTPMHVASAAMNMTQQERERIGLVNQGMPTSPVVDNTVNRRFGSGEITIGKFHRPAVQPITKPVIQEDTSAYYSAMVMKCRFTPYQKPIGVKSKVCVDKRFPMFAVPMIIDDKLGYAYLKEINQNIAATDYIPVATGVEGTYWMFHNMENGKGITFYPDVLTDVICDKRSLFPDIDISGKIRIAVNNFGNLFTDDVDDSKKEAIEGIYTNFFENNPKFFHIMKIDWNTGFVIALSEESTPVLLMAAMVEDGYVEYPKYMTVIPISGSVGFAAVGLSASEVSHIEEALTPWNEEL